MSKAKPTSKDMEPKAEKAVAEVSCDDAEIDANAEGKESEALRALQEEVAILKDKHLRALSEIQNLQKRHERDKKDALSFGNTRLLKDLLSVIDNFDRASAAADVQTDKIEEHFKMLLQGVKLIQKELESFMQKQNVVRIQAEKVDFDPNLHEAMQEEASDDVAAGKVLRVIQSGYQLGERLLRPAMVIVSKGKKSEN